MIRLGDRVVGSGAPALIIAELGTSHQGDLSRARSMIDAAVDAGADCVKFQLVYATELLHPRSGLVDLPTGRIPLFERFRELERDLSFYAALKTHTESRGALFLCSPFGIQSARELHRLGAEAIKVASPELNHLPLLQEVSAFGVPLFLSSGVSTLADIEQALSITGRNNVVLLHCITAYPAPEEQYNVSVLRSLRAVFGVEVGLSDHSLDPELVPTAAAACGAVAVEKHFTLSREGSGLDDPIALEPRDFSRMVAAVRAAERLGPEAAIAGLGARYGRQRVDAVLGSGIKTLAAAERENYRRTNRSIHALREIPQGAVIRSQDVALLRTEKVLRPGLPPELLPRVIGAHAMRLIPDGEGVEWEDILPSQGS
ncbi:MAG TPA: N-acetylneuraminate synthase family protein [Spirochaetia bacterium]|nr:N-acetylneuraminate synthase family protein [Spirochaetia bacterium]